MIWLSWKLVTLPFRVLFAAFGLTYKAVRLVGVSRIAAFGAGVGVGMAVGPETTATVRDGIARRLGSVDSPVDLADMVRSELAHSPRTWHLPQPVVAVDGDRVTLTGDVPHATARADLARTAGAVIGVAAVENRIVVAE